MAVFLCDLESTFLAILAEVLDVEVMFSVDRI